MPSPAQWDIEGAAAQGMTTQCSSELSQPCGSENDGYSLPLLQSHSNALVVSRNGTPASKASSPTPASTKRHRQGGQTASKSLEVYREQLINLFWVHDLPLREVQEIMKRDYGLDFR